MPTAMNVFKSFFSSHMSLQSLEQINGLRVYTRMSDTDDILLTTSSKNQCSHAMAIIPALFDKVSRD